MQAVLGVMGNALFKKLKQNFLFVKICVFSVGSVVTQTKETH